MMPLYDYDYHPPEETVRRLSLHPDSVILKTSAAFVRQNQEPAHSVSATDYLVLRHFAFTEHWFTVNATYALNGEPIETGPDEQTQFAINCDIATPFECSGEAIFSVDLFLDVLIALDGTTTVVDEEQFETAASSGQISLAEAKGAEKGLAELLAWNKSGRLQALLRSFEVLCPAAAPPLLGQDRVPLSEVPQLLPKNRKETRH